MLRLTKHEASSRLREALSDVPAFILLDYTGITVSQDTDLRNKFREGQCKYQVFKNSVVHYAIQGTRHEPVSRLLTGMTALAYSPTDPGAAARIARDFARDAKNFKIKGGVIEGTVLDAAGVNSLADMPGPRELKAQFLALLNTPATSFVRVLNAGPQSLLYLLNARKDQLAA
ncbi:MAG TPA: 50S ribosomal protein L10 [Nannocystis sp.]|jgi:large subunit ribosomal protein L10